MRVRGRESVSQSVSIDNINNIDDKERKFEGGGEGERVSYLISIDIINSIDEEEEKGEGAGESEVVSQSVALLSKHSGKDASPASTQQSSSGCLLTRPPRHTFLLPASLCLFVSSSLSLNTCN